MKCPDETACHATGELKAMHDLLGLCHMEASLIQAQRDQFRHLAERLQALLELERSKRIEAEKQCERYREG